MEPLELRVCHGFLLIGRCLLELPTLLFHTCRLPLLHLLLEALVPNGRLPELGGPLVAPVVGLPPLSLEPVHVLRLGVAPGDLRADGRPGILGFLRCPIAARLFFLAPREGLIQVFFFCLLHFLLQGAPCRLLGNWGRPWRLGEVPRALSPAFQLRCLLPFLVCCLDVLP
eukprot:16437549-Heterocapsa_arctica.AAC.1